MTCHAACVQTIKPVQTSSYCSVSGQLFLIVTVILGVLHWMRPS